MALILIVLIPTPALENERGGAVLGGERFRFITLKE